MEHKHSTKSNLSLTDPKIVDFMLVVAEVVEQVGCGQKDMKEGYEELLKLYNEHTLQ